MRKIITAESEDSTPNFRAMVWLPAISVISNVSVILFTDNPPENGCISFFCGIQVFL